MLVPALQEGASMQVRGPPISERHGLNPKTPKPQNPSFINFIIIIIKIIFHQKK
jgi:hypothetical protein